MENNVLKFTIGRIGTLNMEIKKPYKNKISMLTEESIGLMKEAIEKYEKVRDLNKSINLELEEQEESQ